MLKTIIPEAAINSKYKKYSLSVAVAVLVIFHVVGFWGLLFSGKPEYYQNLTPVNLLVTNALLFAFHKGWNKAFILFAILVFAVGFLSEVVGVHTGLLFGDYVYGRALGLKLWEVPLLIGLNWLMLVYVTGCISSRIKGHWMTKAILGTSLMVLLDFFIEPVAMQFDFWIWNGEAVPFSNYAGWFAVAFILHVYYQKSDFEKQNLLAPFVYLIQVVFFLSLFFLM